MPRIALILLAATSAAVSVSAQTCPVQLFAERQSPLTLQATGEAARPNPSQTLHVIITPTDTPPIQSIEATLHGFSSNAEVLPITHLPARNLTKTFHLERRTGQDSLTSFNLSMSGAGVLRWADVTSITYADGTAWHSPQPSLCRATPSLLTLVATARQNVVKP